MRQDLTDWLNGGSGTEGQNPFPSERTGLLLAPLGSSSEPPAAAKPDLLVATETKAPKTEPQTEKERTPQSAKAEPVPEVPLDPVPKPRPSPEPEPKPEAQPEPQLELQPEPQHEPEPEPQPEPKPTPEPEPEVTLAPEPQAEPEPKSESEPEPDLQPEPGPQPVSEPEPEPVEPVLLKPKTERKPRPMPSLWTHAVSMPDDWSLSGLLDEEDEELEESEGTRNKTFTKKLHKGLQERKSHAMKRRAQEPASVRRYWPRALAFCIVLILTLTGAWAVLRYLQAHILQPLDGEGHTHAVQTDVPKDVPAAPSGVISAPVPAVKPVPVEKPAQPVEKPAPVKTPVPAVERPTTPVQPVPLETPAQLVEKPAPVKVPVPPVKSAPVEKPAQPVEKPAPVKEPVPLAEKPMPPVKSAPVGKPSQPEVKPAPVKKPAEPVLPLSYEGQVRLGTAALNNKRYDEALETFSRALERRKDDPRAWLGIVAAFEGKGAVGEAFRVLVDARNTLPGNPTVEVKLRDLQRRVR